MNNKDILNSLRVESNTFHILDGGKPKSSIFNQNNETLIIDSFGEVDSITEIIMKINLSNRIVNALEITNAGIKNNTQSLVISDYTNNIPTTKWVTDKITPLHDKTVFQTANSTATIFSKQINVPNGNIGYINPLSQNDFYIQSNLPSGNNIYLNSGLANNNYLQSAETHLQSKQVYLGATGTTNKNTTTQRNSNLLFLKSDGVTWETQSSAFTEALKSQLTSFQTTTSADITDLETKTQNISLTTTTDLTNMSKPLNINSTGECLRMTGEYSYISAYDSLNSTRNWYIGTPDQGANIDIKNENYGSINIYSGHNGIIDDTGKTVSGNNKINTYSSGLVFYRGEGDTNIPSEIGLIDASNNIFYINSSGNDMILTNTSKVEILTPEINLGSATKLNFYDSTGYVTTQSSAFTETLKTQIGTNTTKLQNITANSTETIFSTQINVPNGNIGYINPLSVNDFYIRSKSGLENTYLQSAETHLQSKQVYLGTTGTTNKNTTTQRNSNLLFLKSDGVTWETQSSAFTEALKSQLTSFQTTTSADITDLETKTQNISLTTTTDLTNMSKPLNINSTGECLRMTGEYSYISAYDSLNSTRNWYIGTPDQGANIDIKNENYGSINIYSGHNGIIDDTGKTVSGNNKINTYSSGLVFYRGEGDTNIPSEIGLIDASNNIFYINSSGNDMILTNTSKVEILTPEINLGSATKLNFYDSTGYVTTQSSAFTETLKTQIGTNTTKLQNITAYEDATIMNKPLIITLGGECLKTAGSYTFWSGYDEFGTQHFLIGKQTHNSNRLMINNYLEGEIVLRSGSRSENTNLGQNKIITHSNGISLRRGGITGDSEIIVGEIGATGIGDDKNFYINGNSSNNFIVDSGFGSILLKTDNIIIGKNTNTTIKIDNTISKITFDNPVNVNGSFSIGTTAASISTTGAGTFTSVSAGSGSISTTGAGSFGSISTTGTVSFGSISTTGAGSFGSVSAGSDSMV